MQPAELIRAGARLSDRPGRGGGDDTHRLLVLRRRRHVVQVLQPLLHLLQLKLHRVTLLHGERRPRSDHARPRPVHAAGTGAGSRPELTAHLRRHARPRPAREARLAVRRHARLARVHARVHAGRHRAGHVRRHARVLRRPGGAGRGRHLPAGRRHGRARSAGHRERRGTAVRRPAGHHRTRCAGWWRSDAPGRRRTRRRVTTRGRHPRSTGPHCR